MRINMHAPRCNPLTSLLQAEGEDGNWEEDFGGGPEYEEVAALAEAVAHVM